MKILVTTVVAVLLTSLVVGCGQPKAVLVPVTGTLKIDGEPAAGIMVQLVPDTQDESIDAPTSQGITDENGEFELFTTKNEPGAIVGKHKVALIDTEEERPAQGEVATREPRLDPKYSLAGEIMVDVADGKKLEIEATGPY